MFIERKKKKNTRMDKKPSHTKVFRVNELIWQWQNKQGPQSTKSFFSNIKQNKRSNRFYAQHQEK